MKFSIIVCTYNRSSALRLTLESFARLVTPPGFAWEMLLVDNRSTDATRSVCESFLADYPGQSRYWYEPRSGKSYGLNTAIRSARGEVLVFTDDDCVADPLWLQKIHEEYSSDPELAILGGRVELYNKEDQPVTTLISSERSVVSSPLSVFFPRVQVIGCNMAIKRKVFDTVGLFDPNLGPGSRGESCEDCDFYYRSLMHGFKIAYSPAPVVYHNHGRRTQQDVKRVKGTYFLSRGAFYCLRWSDKEVRRIAGYEARDIALTIRYHFREGSRVRDALYRACKLLAGALRIFLRRLPVDDALRPVTSREPVGNKQLSNRPSKDGIPEATSCYGCDHEAKPRTVAPLMPKVSIIIPTYNCEAFVEDCIRSVTNQSERDIEIIVVDDGSTDGTLSILKKLASEDSRIFTHSRPNSGYPGTTRNQGLSHARGKYVAFLDGDDLYHPEKVQKILSAFESFPETDVVFHDLFRLEQHLDEAGAASFLTNAGFLKLAADYLIEAEHAVFLCRENLYSFASLQFIPFHTSAIAFRKDLLLAEPVWFREDLRAGEDQDLWLRLAKNRRFAFVNEPLSYYRQRSGSITSDQVQGLLGGIQIHRENLERGREIFSERQVRLYRSKIAHLLFDLGYAYFCRFSMKEARQVYKESLSADFRANTLFAYLKTFLPRPIITRYRQSAE